MNGLALIRLALTQHLRKQLPEQNRVVRKVFGHGNHALDYTQSGDDSRGKNLMWTVAPQIIAVQQSVELLNRQHSSFIRTIRRGFEALGFQAL